MIAPRGSNTRPTAAKIREAIFNILGPPPDGVDGVILDLYAGTGALGIEALSRGAPRAVFVERDHQALVALRRNIRELGLEDRSTIIGADVRAGIRRLKADGRRFSWVFLDPPYVKETEGVLAELGSNDLLAPCAVVVVEHDRRNSPPGNITGGVASVVTGSLGGLFLTDRRSYGDTCLSFYRGSGS